MFISFNYIRRIDEEISAASKLYTQQVHQLTQSRIKGKKDDIVRSAFDREMFVKTLGMMQKYSIEEVLKSSDVHPEDDVNRYQSLKRDMRTINLGPVHNFIETYMGDTEIKLVGDFDENNQLHIYVVGADRVSVQDFIDIAQEQGLVRVEDIPTVEPWKSPTLDNYEIEPDIQANQRIQELLGQLEELGQTAYFWVTEDDLNQPTEVVAQLDQWFSSGEAHSVYESDTFELVVGDNTYMIEFKNRNLSLQNMEAYAQTVSEWIEEVGVDTVALHLEATIEEFNQVKQSLTEGMDKQLQAIQQSLLRHPSPVESVQAGIGRFFERVQKQARAIFEQETNSDQKEKALEQAQGQEMDRTSVGTDSLQLEAEGSVKPVSHDTFEQTVTSHPTSSYPLLHFSTNFSEIQRRIGNYHPVTEADIKRLNQYAPSIQSTAQWYLNELADQKISYVYLDNGQENLLQVDFKKENFIHLVGIRPVEDGKQAGDFLVELAQGEGNFNQLLISNSIKYKLQVLPMLSDILDSHSFILNDLSSVEKLNRLNFSEAIQSKDEDFLLLFRESENGTVPASLMKLKGELSTSIRGINEKVVLGVYRERDGIIEQLSIHPDYVKDGGQSMMTVLQNKQYETLSTSQTMQEETNITSFSSDRLQDEPALPVSMMDSDADGISDEEEKKQGSDPYDFRSQPATKHQEEREEKEVEDSSLVVANLIQNQDIAGLNRHLKDGIKDYLDSDKYKDYLTKMSQLNNYSSRNLRLILAQHPTASQVASFKQWKEIFGRHVKKGEKALRIFVPITYIKKDENNQPILDKDGKPEIGTTFRLKAAVFDVSQTDGKEMPKAVSEVKDQLTDQDYGNLYRTLMTIAKNNHVSVCFEELEESRKGYYDTANHQIVLNKVGMNKSQLIKTFLHETAHSELHHKDHPQKDQLTRSTAELQAESVAYVVASYYGLDTSNYSFGYLASWSQDKDTLRDLEAQLDIVQQEAKSLIERMDKEMEVLRLSQAKQTQHQFENKLNHFKEQSDKQLKELQEKRQAEAHSKKEMAISK